MLSEIDKIRRWVFDVNWTSQLNKLALVIIICGTFWAGSRVTTNKFWNVYNSCEQGLVYLKYERLWSYLTPSLNAYCVHGLEVKEELMQ